MIEKDLEIINSFKELIQAIINRPAMYMVNNVEDLGLVIFGYLAGVGRTTDNNVLNKFMGDFRKFTNKHFETTFDYDWDRLIRFHSSGDKGSLELFKKLFDLFINEDEIAI